MTRFVLHALVFALFACAWALAPQSATAQTSRRSTAAVMPAIHRPAGFSAAQVEALRQAAEDALGRVAYRVLTRSEVATRIASGPRCPPPGPCLEAAHRASRVSVLVHLEVQGTAAATRVTVQLTDGTRRVRHQVRAPADRVAAEVHRAVQQAARRLRLSAD